MILRVRADEMEVIWPRIHAGVPIYGEVPRDTVLGNIEGAGPQRCCMQSLANVKQRYLPIGVRIGTSEERYFSCKNVSWR